jgi:hypothetical protein
MSARRYDKNADQLAQIYSFFKDLGVKGTYLEDIAMPMREELLEILERALTLNDFMGKLAEKGLI